MKPLKNEKLENKAVEIAKIWADVGVAAAVHALGDACEEFKLVRWESNVLSDRVTHLFEEHMMRREAKKVVETLSSRGEVAGACEMSNFAKKRIMTPSLAARFESMVYSMYEEKLIKEQAEM